MPGVAALEGGAPRGVAGLPSVADVDVAGLTGLTGLAGVGVADLTGVGRSSLPPQPEHQRSPGFEALSQFQHEMCFVSRSSPLSSTHKSSSI